MLKKILKKYGKLARLGQLRLAWGLVAALLLLPMSGAEAIARSHNLGLQQAQGIYADIESTPAHPQVILDDKQLPDSLQKPEIDKKDKDSDKQHKDETGNQPNTSDTDEADITAEDYVPAGGQKAEPEHEGKSSDLFKVWRPLYTGGKPWLNYSIADQTFPREAPKLQDDFYTNINYYWLQDWIVNKDVNGFDNFSDVLGDVDINLARLLESPMVFDHDSSITQKVYRMVKDWDARDKQGFQPLMPDLRALESIQTMADMDAYLLGETVPPAGFLEPDMQVDLNDAKHYAMNILPMGFTLGDTAEYTSLTAYGKRLKKANNTAIRQLLQLAGYGEAEAEKKLAAMYRVEYALAGSVHTRQEQAGPNYLKSINNPVTRAELQEMAGAYPIMQLLDKYGLGQAERFNVPEPAYLKALAAYYRPEHLQDMKDALVANRVLENMENLNAAANDVAIGHYAALNGRKVHLPDWVTAVEYVKRVLPGPLSNMYAENYCTKEQKKEIQDIVADVCSYYKEMLQQEDFLSESTREKAIEKLDKMRVRAVMPDKPQNYRDIKLNKCKNLIQVRQALLQWEIRRIQQQINGPVTEEWTPCFTVNASYSPTDNSLNIPAGILNGIFYQDDYSYEEKLGGIGIIIGHEITHGFDTTGAQFDAEGNMANWWSEEDKAAFEARAEKVAAYLDGITVFDQLNCNGEVEKTEVIADLGGMKCMLAMGAKRPDFDYKKFFQHYATLWRSVCTRENAEQQVRIDEHPLDYLRVNICVQQFPEFYTAYHIQPEDNMYLAPEKRIGLW